MPDLNQNWTDYKKKKNYDHLLGRYIIPDFMLNHFCIGCLSSFSRQPYSHFMNEETEPEDTEKHMQGQSAGKGQSGDLT